jgi:hypothetical protein
MFCRMLEPVCVRKWMGPRGLISAIMMRMNATGRRQSQHKEDENKTRPTHGSSAVPIPSRFNQPSHLDALAGHATSRLREQVQEQFEQLRTTLSKAKAMLDELAEREVINTLMKTPYFSAISSGFNVHRSDHKGDLAHKDQGPTKTEASQMSKSVKVHPVQVSAGEARAQGAAS